MILSRRDPELIKTLFELEVPEIADGLVEIRGVAREPGYRSKIAVESHAQGVDPVGACVGPRGSRVRMVVSELRGEKIDIIPWNTEPARFVAKALSPARVREVYIDDDTREATVVVPDDQLALAIGKDGLNARLAARLTGWKVDIQSGHRVRPGRGRGARSRGEDDRQDFSGRCAAILSNGKRCHERGAAGAAAGVPARTRRWSDGSQEAVQSAGSRSSPRRRRRESLEPVCRSCGGRVDELEINVWWRSRKRATSRCSRGRGGRSTVTSPEHACAGCGRKAPQSELQRFVARSGALSRAEGPGRGASTPAVSSPASERAADRPVQPRRSG